jgi:hypothetical protein
MITTSTEFIDALGGTKNLAEELGVGQPCISNWRKLGIPPSWYLPLARKAVERGVFFSPQIFREKKRDKAA